MDKICQNYKNSLYSGLSKIGKCLSSEKRIEILDLLVQGAKTVGIMLFMKSQIHK